MDFTLHDDGLVFGGVLSSSSKIADRVAERRWYVVYTLPQQEKSVAKHFEMIGIESFLPVRETVRVWKNRQRINLILPLFPNYAFVRINREERVDVLQTSG